MENPARDRSRERGGAAVKFAIILTVLFLVGFAGANYIPVAYEGASFRQEMDTAVVKGIAASGQLKPVDTVKASIQKSLRDYAIPADAYVEIKQAGPVVQAHVIYSKQVSTYNFDYVATPAGYLLKA
jgi:hypothetical protein